VVLLRRRSGRGSIGLRRRSGGHLLRRRRCVDHLRLRSTRSNLDLSRARIVPATSED
jgi:hypothetical protein